MKKKKKKKSGEKCAKGHFTIKSTGNRDENRNRKQRYGPNGQRSRLSRESYRKRTTITR